VRWDEHTTVDLCYDDHFPIVTWAQRGETGPIFAPRDWAHLCPRQAYAFAGCCLLLEVV